jgi:hypothetical protein
MVEAPPARGDLPQTLEAAAALALVDGMAQDLLFQEIRLLDIDNQARRRRWRVAPQLGARDSASARRVRMGAASLTPGVHNAKWLAKI